MIATPDSSDEVIKSPFKREAGNLAPVLLKGTKRVITKGATTSRSSLTEAPRPSLIEIRRARSFKDVDRHHSCDSGIDLKVDIGPASLSLGRLMCF